MGGGRTKKALEELAAINGGYPRLPGTSCHMLAALTTNRIDRSTLEGVEEL